MYKEFYGFRKKPFNLVPNPSYLFLSSRHSNALTFLEYGLSEKVGFVMLTGEIGIGKTTLVRYLLNQVESDMDVAVIFNTNLVSKDLITLVLNEFEIAYEDGISKTKALDLLYEFLIDRYAKGRKVLLIIDEAQNLTDEVLEEIRMLSNLQTDEEMLLQIMIVGQPELREKINNPRLEQFAQRIAVSYHLGAMSLEETAKYIIYRTEKAEGRPDLFTAEAVKKIHQTAAGIPRTINLLCDAALVYGFAEERETIELDIVEQVIEDKGGMGIFTKAGLEKRMEDAEKESNLNEKDLKDLYKKVERIEISFADLSEVYKQNLAYLESKVESYREKMINEFRYALLSQQQRNAKLASAYGQLKERNRILLKRIAEKNEEESNNSNQDI